MRWTNALAVVAVLGMARTGSLTANTKAAPEWPPVVPRLASYTEEQKAAITAVVEQYCVNNYSPKRTELQAHIHALLTPPQVVEATRYWLSQALQRDVREFLGQQTLQDKLDACGRKMRLTA